LLEHHLYAWMIELDGLIVDARALPAHRQAAARQHEASRLPSYGHVNDRSSHPHTHTPRCQTPIPMSPAALLPIILLGIA
jgi:hypothetical protein